MNGSTWWMLIGAALVLGAGIGGWLGWRLGALRSEARLKRAVDELQQRHATATEQGRAAQVRAQTELEQSRGSIKRQIAAALEEPRAAATRAEERLRAAYDEIDRLRRAGRPADTGSAELTDGFAPTRPMHNAM